jgi:hypothetical protein
MISYCWSQQPLVLHLCKQLRVLNIPYWLDVEQMHGNINDRMAEAIETCSVVLVVLSSKYKLSANCRMEAEYSATQRKPIIPLMGEKGYRPDGWLGLLVSGKLWYDVSNTESVSSNAQSIVGAAVPFMLELMQSDAAAGPASAAALSSKKGQQPEKLSMVSAAELVSSTATAAAGGATAAAANKDVQQQQQQSRGSALLSSDIDDETFVAIGVAAAAAGASSTSAGNASTSPGGAGAGAGVVTIDVQALLNDIGLRLEQQLSQQLLPVMDCLQRLDGRMGAVEQAVQALAEQQK